MSDWKTIKIPPEEYERHNAKRKNLGETWAEYINGQAPDYVDVDDLKVVAATPEDLTALRSDLLERLDRIEDAVTQDESSGLMDAMNESDNDGCPECGGDLVHEMGSEAKRCPACGWSEND